MRWCGDAMMFPMDTRRGIRTTLALDVEIVDAARKLALSRSHSLGQVISELARRGLARELGQSVHRGFPVFRVPRNAPPLSLDDVKRPHPLRAAVYRASLHHRPASATIPTGGSPNPERDAHDQGMPSGQTGVHRLDVTCSSRWHVPNMSTTVSPTSGFTAVVGDAYLLALAQDHEGRLATLGSSVAALIGDPDERPHRVTVIP